MSVPVSAHTAPSTEERLARVTISLIAEPGDPIFLGLTRELGGVGFLQALQEQPDRHELLAAAAARLADVDPERELDAAQAQGIRFVIPGDAEWPAGLDDLAEAGSVQERGDVPPGLWVKGPLALDRLEGSVAVVGSRSATSYGERTAGDIAAVIGTSGRAVVSGAAFGIDYAAHRGALSIGAPTVAVLACGVDRCYPAAHRRLLEYLAREAAVVSEAPIGSAPHRVRFLARNRLIAALSVGTVVVEAAARSGALSTVGWAQRLNRIVMGVPGPVTAAGSVGVHHQIRSGGAALVTSGHDVLELVGGAGEHLTEDPRGPETARDRLRVRERQVLDAVPVTAGVGADSIAKVAGLGVVEVRKVLERLLQHELVEYDGAGWRLTDAARS